jgi:hypothetical protein
MPAAVVLVVSEQLRIWTPHSVIRGYSLRRLNASDRK